MCLYLLGIGENTLSTLGVGDIVLINLIGVTLPGYYGSPPANSYGIWLIKLT